MLISSSFKVIIPAIVQSLVSKQSLPIESGSLIVLDPRTIKISLTTELDTPLPVDIDTTVLHLYNKNTTTYSPYLNITLDGMHVNHKTTVSVVNQTVPIANVSEASVWLDQVFDREVADVSIKSDLTVRLGALTSYPSLDKTVTIPGLRKLSGLGIQDLKLSMTADKDGNNVQGALNVPNWGVLKLFLGDITFDLATAGITIGQVTLKDTMLNPGNNTCPFSGTLSIPNVISNIGTILPAQAEPLKDGKIRLQAKGNKTVINGERIGIVESVLNTRTLEFDTPVISLLTDVLGSFIGSSNGKDVLSNLLSGTIGNSTLVAEALGHWNKTSNGNSTTPKAPKSKRSQDNIMWNIMRMAINMKMNHPEL